MPAYAGPSSLFAMQLSLLIKIILLAVPGVARKSEDWLGWKDSNLRMPGPKPGALPLGYTPRIFLIILGNLN